MKIFTGLVLAGALAAQVRTVGPAAGGGTLLPTGWVVKPAGQQVPLKGLPMASALSPDGQFVVVLQAGAAAPSVSLHEAATLKELDRMALKDAWLGLVFAPESRRFYVSGGSTATVLEMEITAEKKLSLRRTFPVVPEKDRKATDFVGDVRMTPDGHLLFVAALLRNEIFVINPASGMVIEDWKTGQRPYRILFHPDGKSFYVTGWGDGSLYHQSAQTGEILGRYPVGLEPMDMVWRPKAPEVDPGQEAPPYSARLFVAVAGTNNVVVFGVTEDKSMFRVDSVYMALGANNQPSGMAPAGLALSEDQERVFVVCSGANAVAQVAVAGTRGLVEGLIPTGSYPTAALTLPGQRLMILNGAGSSASVVGARGPEQVDADTETVVAGSPYKPGGAVDVPKVPVDHVIYVLRAGRTYDEALGDLPKTNGTASMASYGAAVSPNLHKLAAEYAVLDNFFTVGESLAEGWNWSVSAWAAPFVRLLAGGAEAGRYTVAGLEGGERAALAPVGYLWSNARQKGIAVRNYGLWVTNGATEVTPKDPSLAAVTNRAFRGGDAEYKDTDRVKAFLSDLAGFEKAGQMPALLLVRLSNDGAASKAMAADSDLALGQLVEAVSRSKFWGTTAVFVVEAATGGGADHVDARRAPAVVVSPWTKGRGTDSTFSTTMSVLRTLEAAVGLAPMTIHDAGAAVMTGVFGTAADGAAYAAVTPRP